MKKALLIAACAVLMTGVAANAASLTMAITGDASAQAGEPFAFQIWATLGAGSDGLALIGVDLEGTSNVTLSPLSPGASMSSFVKVEGLTNPDGYGGTDVAGKLLQIGGGQNTIGYSTDDPAYPNPDYPVGDVVLGIGDEVAVMIAEGTVTAPGEGEEFTLTISNAFANTVDEGQTEAPYAVSAVDEPVIYDPAFITRIVSGGIVPQLTAASSVGEHTGEGDLALPIGVDGLNEPRVQGGGELYLVLEFDGDVDAGGLSAAFAPALGVGASVTAGAASNMAEIHFDGNVATDRYTVTLSGAGEGSFDICYVQGDVNCSGDATGLDLAAIQSPGNWNKLLSEGASVRADVNRDGQATGLDLAAVQSPASWNQPVPPLTCGCP